MTRLTSATAIGLLVLAGLNGCQTSGGLSSSTKRAMRSDLARAEQRYQQGDATGAMIACIDLARKDPLMPGLADLQVRILTSLNEQRQQANRAREPVDYRRMQVDVMDKQIVPDTYGIRRRVQGESGPMRTPPTPMDLVLERNVTVHLDAVGLSDFILAVGEAENVNIIADDQIGEDKTMTIHADNVPLVEILDYVARNLGVEFSIGEHVVWATQTADSETGVPLETRFYRLRKGVSATEIEAGAGKIMIEEAIERFVPSVAGSDMLYDPKAHAVLARNTRANLAAIERIIEALDVVPPQVLIEARFILTDVSDLRELGVDWILNSPIVISSKDVLRNGTVVSANRTQINPTDPEAIVGFTPFASQAQGLNLTYQGVLTDPMFTAVLHALETTGDSRTLSVPRITTVNNSPALIRIGEDFRYFEEYDVVETLSGTTSEGRDTYIAQQVPVGTPTLEELGITLDVTPSVGADMTSITLRILPEISDFLRWEYWEVGTTRGGSARNNNNDSVQATATNVTSSIKLPIFQRSTLETEVVTRSGETVVMGGLIRSVESRSLEKVPILGDVPWLGRLFRHDTVEEKKQNLLIFVTGTILSETGETLVPPVDEIVAPPADETNVTAAAVAAVADAETAEGE